MVGVYERRLPAMTHYLCFLSLCLAYWYPALIGKFFHHDSKYVPQFSTIAG